MMRADASIHPFKNTSRGVKNYDGDACKDDDGKGNIMQLAFLYTLSTIVRLPPTKNPTSLHILEE